MTRNWEVREDRDMVVWNGVPWALSTEGASPGLRLASDPGRTALALAGISDVGRFDASAFDRSALVGVERHLGAIRAIYRPEGWWGTTVSATWTPVDEDAVGLMVHLQADSVDKLRAVEVWVGSAPFGPPTPSSEDRRLEPRDGRGEGAALSAARSLEGFETSPPPANRTLDPFVVSDGRSTYAEFAAFSDCTRRVFERDSEGRAAVRAALFGHPLEKGVAIRGRLHGFFRPGSPDNPRIQAEFERFLSEPIPLGP